MNGIVLALILLPQETDQERLKRLEQQLEQVQAEVAELRKREVERESRGDAAPAGYRESDEKAVTSSADLSIGGQYRAMFMMNNFGWQPAFLTDSQDGADFANQRFRLWFDLQTIETVGAYLQLEFGHHLWGADGDFPKTYGDAAFAGDTDEVGVELRRGYIWYKNESLGNFRVGIQDVSDRFWDTIMSADFDFNVAGVEWRVPDDLAPLDLRAGIFMLFDGVAGDAKDDTLLLAFDVDHPVEDSGWTLGGSIYHVQDRGSYSYGVFGGPAAVYERSNDTWVGARAWYKDEEVFEEGTLEAGLLAIYNWGGTRRPRWRHWV